MRGYKWIKWTMCGVLLLCPALFGCPVYNLLHISCPTCGVTRAWISFFKGDIFTALTNHFFFAGVPMFLIGVFLLDILSARFKKRVQRVLFIFAVVIFLYNGLRWCGLVASP